MGRLGGKNAVVIGAGSGAAVACVENDKTMGEETAALIRTEGGDAVFIECDLAHSTAIEGMARSCMAWRDTLHVLFNNTAPFLCSQKLLPALKAAGGAAIIHHGSIDGVLGNSTLTTYSADKGGL